MAIETYADQQAPTPELYASSAPGPRFHRYRAARLGRTTSPAPGTAEAGGQPVL